MEALNRVFMNRLMLLVVICMTALSAHAQFLTISTDRNSILLGEQFTLEVKLTAPLGSRISRWPSVPDSVNHLEVVERGGIDSIRQGDKMLYTQKIMMTGFDSGHWVIPALKGEVGGKEVGSATAAIDVQNIKLEGSEYNDVKEIIEVEPPGPDWKRIALFALGVALILALAWYWWKNRKTKEARPVQVSRGTAYEEAIRQLNQLRQDGLLGKGELKKYYSRLYDIYRTYLGAIQGRSAMQLTTDDILVGLKGGLDNSTFTGTAEALRVCDAVKFAKYKPATDTGTRTLEQIRSTIEAMNKA